MRIRYIGHSCFYLETDDGTRAVIDPYDESIGLTPVRLEADVVLVTHHHPDHDCLDGVSGDYEVIDGPGEYETRGLRARGLSLPHDDQNGALRGLVTAYLVEGDGLRVLHLGDVGAMPDESFFEEAGAPIDVLMLPVGGLYTVDAREAMAIADRLNPNRIIPMHYRTTRLKLNLAPVSGFVGLAKHGYDIQRQGDVLEVRRGDKKKRGRVILMENSF